MIRGIVAASRLGLLPREHVKLVFTSGEKSLVASFVYLGSFETGFKEYDEDLVLIPFEDLKRLYDLPDALSSIQIKLDNLNRAGEVAETLVSRLGEDYEVQDWRTMHKNLFAAMSLEKKAMSVILFVLILVAASGIAGGVAILITNKRKEIGILKSMGAQNNSIQTIFLLEGLTIGICGILAGGVTGVLFCYLADKYRWIHVDIDLFGTFYVPFILHAGDLFIIASGAILICLIAAFLPAWKAAKIDPIRAIRE
jgi:lipoprotein-releasing system permease protein